MDFVFDHSSTMDISRRRGSVESGSFAVPLVSAFRSFDEQRCGQHQQLSCDTSSHQETRDQTGDSDDDDDDDCSSRGSDHGVVVDRTNDGMRRGSGSTERRGVDTVSHIAAGDHGGPASHQLTSRKHDYTVAELLRNDRPSSSATFGLQRDSGPSDSHRHDDEAGISPSQTANSAFHSWNVEQVGRPTAPLPPPFPLYTMHHHRWTELMLSGNSRRTEFDNEAQRRFLGLFDTAPVNFLCTYGHLRRGTGRHLPLSAFGQEYSIPHRSRNCQLIRMFTRILCRSTWL